MRKILVLTLAIMFALPVVSQPYAQIKTFKEPPFEFYKVSQGDTFWYIAQRYGLDYRRLMELNPNVVPTNMHVGEIIRLKPTATSPSSFEEQVVQLVNQERAKAGLKPLTHRADIKNVAYKKAQDMINSNYFSHTSPNYGSPFQMLKTFGVSYRTAGENIAKGQKTPQEVMNAWMNSPGHRANILKPEYDSIGVGFYHSAWVQMFVGS
ncbi:CAP domain-containing protein [Bacillus sp. PS06]|uniref:CAP domain-containing protein n=1 Tax=Bacillus sp. PS06 TaxID=2764176 RepID=UPI001785D81D|nr:CAP domain-containing protein [Bacillus sp. PS06]MBD8071455.1 LysM peptidoglycan-binding domain-containing protein [Bacillus sp. PS06]